MVIAGLESVNVTPARAEQLRRLALALPHFSPEPRVIERLIDSAELLGRPQEAEFYRVRLEAAFARQ